MASLAAPEYRFDRYRLVPGRRELLADERPIKLGGRAFDTLLTLVEARDRAVAKAELMERVWPHLVVEENNLQVQIAALRKLLGPGAIATIPGRGYRFTLPVESSGPVAPSRPVMSARDDGRADRGNVTPDAAPLYGRDDDVAAVVALVERHDLVSVVGPAGIGKTRLGRAVASALRDAYADGAWIVELAALGDPQLVAAEVARVLGIKGAASAGAIVADLASSSRLLVLDNCEHVLDAVAALVDALLRGVAGLHVLITSQEPIKLPQENVYRLATLAVPKTSDSAEAERSGAVQLFVRRAQAADPRFRMTDATLPAIVEICRRLDGIPLALEFAAARVPLLGVDGLRDRLDERFHILTAGARFVLRQHQTLHAALDFSHGLLEDDERTVFRRLGVFAGSFALASGQRLCVDERIDEWRALDLLGALVDKSMVIAQGDASPRLRLLETARAYALEKLGEAQETLPLLARHARVTAAQWRPAYDDYWKLAPDEWLERYEPELDNLRAAIEWSVRNEPQLAVQLVGDSLKLWQDLALHPEGLRHCAAALAHVDDTTPPRAAGRLWYAEAMLLANSHPTRSHAAARRAIALLREADDPEILAMALARLAGTLATPTQEQWDALAELERVHRPEWTGQLRTLTAVARAMLNRATGRFAEARRDYEYCRNLARELGLRGAELRERVNVADVVLQMGDLDEGIAMFRDLAAELKDRPDQLFYLFSVVNLAGALLQKGDLTAGREHFRAAWPLIVRYDLVHRYAYTAALLAALEGRAAAAARLIGYGEQANAARTKYIDAFQAAARAQAERILAAVDAEQVSKWMEEGTRSRGEDLHAQALAPS